MNEDHKDPFQYHSRKANTPVGCETSFLLGKNQGCVFYRKITGVRIWKIRYCVLTSRQEAWYQNLNLKMFTQVQSDPCLGGQMNIYSDLYR